MSPTKKEIQEHEKDLQLLLGRLMQGPLEPFLRRQVEHGERLAAVEQRVGELAKDLPDALSDGIEGIPKLLGTELRKFGVSLEEKISSGQVALEARLSGIDEELGGVANSLGGAVMAAIAALPEKINTQLAAIRVDIEEMFGSVAAEYQGVFTDQIGEISRSQGEAGAAAERRDALVLERLGDLQRMHMIAVRRLRAGLIFLATTTGVSLLVAAWAVYRLA